ncbi:PP2C family protein-serine/threonine phosphatase [Streptomyces sp. NPDC059373]
MIRTRAAIRVRGLAVFLLPGVWVAGVLAVALLVPGGVHCVSAVAVAPAIACAGSGRRRCVAMSGALAFVALAVAVVVADEGEGIAPRTGTAVTTLAVVILCLWLADRKARLAAELDRTREIAVAAQQVLLRPLPRRVNGVAVAGDYLSASRGAHVGGDLYEVLATPYGLRAVIGDVRGHGLAAIGTVATLLGGFREAAHDEPELGGVLRRLDRTLARHLRERAHAEHPAVASEPPEFPAAEEFVTLLLLQLGEDGGTQLINCGHPPPYRISADCPGGVCAAQIEAGEPLPPLGLFEPGDDLAAVRCGPLPPGQALFCHTDGVADARNAAGAFFPLATELEAAARASVRGGSLCARVLVQSMSARFLRHTKGRLTDDMALLLLHRDVPRVPAQIAQAAHVRKAARRLPGVPRR